MDKNGNLKIGFCIVVVFIFGVCAVFGIKDIVVDGFSIERVLYVLRDAVIALAFVFESKKAVGRKN